VIDRFLSDRGLRAAEVPRAFPLGLADALRAKGIALTIRSGLEDRRRVKRADELAAIEATQHATEEAWGLGVDAIRSATVGADRVLQRGGSPFTAERLRAIIESALLERGCGSPEGTICAPGLQAADPHQEGSGPLRANEAIVMDIYPQSNATRYHADMTRTVSRGEPSAAIVRMYDVVKRAQDAGIAALRPGVTGKEVHELVEDIIFAAGFDTLRPGQQHDGAGDSTLSWRRGFIHGLGHGVGLQIHEAPSVGRGGTKPLVVGDVVTIEPGVYDPAVGGVRLEDLLVITAEGARNLTRAPRQLVI
ncbi:MAG: M24 family metallopeptidase, partial [Chloroflexi bacterium]|nr:M24 family metallopeptidase [Chloroflexota bacterium]